MLLMHWPKATAVGVAARLGMVTVCTDSCSKKYILAVWGTLDIKNELTELHYIALKSRKMTSKRAT